MGNELDWLTEVNVGEQYQFEDRYFFACDVTIMESRHGKDSSRYRADTWVGFLVRCDRVIFRMEGAGVEVGETWEVGYDTMYRHYNSLKLKPLGSPTDYVYFEGD